jgi:hypothetical protein
MMNKPKSAKQHGEYIHVGMWIHFVTHDLRACRRRCKRRRATKIGEEGEKSSSPPPSALFPSPLCSPPKPTKKKTLQKSTTHVKISHLVTSLPTSRQQDLFALLVTNCQQVWNNLLTTCNNLVEIIRLVARLFWQVRYMLDITRLI